MLIAVPFGAEISSDLNFCFFICFPFSLLQWSLITRVTNKVAWNEHRRVASLKDQMSHGGTLNVAVACPLSSTLSLLPCSWSFLSRIRPRRRLQEQRCRLLLSCSPKPGNVFDPTALFHNHEHVRNFWHWLTRYTSNKTPPEDSLSHLHVEERRPN